MVLKLAQCPCSWSVEDPVARSAPSWQTFLDEVVAAGYRGVELGPLGYLPTDPDELRIALDTRGLALCAGYVMEPLTDPDSLPRTIERTKETAAILSAAGATHLVVIDALDPARSATAGRSDAAPRLEPDAFHRLVDAVHVIAKVAVEDFGLLASFHPHVGTHVEFQDEIERLFSLADPSLVGLCLDTGHAVYAGADPVALFDAYAGRIGYMHLKDVDPEVLDHASRAGLDFETAVDRGLFCPVGRGVVDYPSLIARMESAAYRGWLAVEQDRDALVPGSDRALADARLSLEYLRTATSDSGVVEPR